MTTMAASLLNSVHHLDHLDQMDHKLFHDLSFHEPSLLAFEPQHDHLGPHLGAQQLLDCSQQLVDGESLEMYLDDFSLRKRVPEFGLDLECAQNWSLKSPQEWSPHEVSDWLRTWAMHNGVSELELAHLLYNPLSGFELCQLRSDYFLQVSPNYGLMIFDSLQSLIQQNNCFDPFPNPFPDLLQQQITCLQDLDQSPVSQSESSNLLSDSERESTSSHLSQINEKKPLLEQLEPKMTSPVAQVAVKKAGGRRGRPPKKDGKSRNKGNGKLWEFIRDLLLNPVTNPALIRWERREDGVFKFVQSDKVAKMWGERKQNPRMTYEKLSRAMRYYYKSQVLLPVFGRRLVYKFGPNATGWRPQFDHVLTQK